MQFYYRVVPHLILFWCLYFSFDLSIFCILYVNHLWRCVHNSKWHLTLFFYLAHTALVFYMANTWSSKPTPVNKFTGSTLLTLKYRKTFHVLWHFSVAFSSNHKVSILMKILSYSYELLNSHHKCNTQLVGQRVY